jgi:cell division protein FtsL
MKNPLYFCLLGMLLVASSSAQAGTKEELVRLQTDVLALQNQIRSLEQTFSDQTQGLKSLVVQLNDQTGKMNLLLEKVSSLLETQAEGGKSGDEAVLQEIAKISVKLDDTTTRMSALAQQLSDLKVQQD